MLKTSDYMTVVIRLPEDKGQRKQIADALQIGGTFHGGQITAMSLEDEITILDCIEAHQHFDENIADDARNTAKRLHAEAEAPAR